MTIEVPGLTMERVAIFTGDLAAYSVRRGLGELVRRFPNIHWLVIEHRPARQWARVVRNLGKNIGRDGWRWFPAVGMAMMQAAQARSVDHAAPRSNLPGQEFELTTLLKHRTVSLIRTNDIHASATLAAVRGFNPDLGISLAAPILKADLFEIPRLGTINLHKGRLPDYRGMPPAFWEVWNGARDVGCTVHQVESKLDAGPILVSRIVPIEKFSTVRGLQIRLDEVGVDLTCEAVEKLQRGGVIPEAQAGKGTLYRKPTLAQWAVVRGREPGVVSLGWRSRAKEVFFACYVLCVRPVARRLLALAGRQRVTVLLYHRVCDDMRDSVTVGLEQFERQMIDVGQRCRVVPIEDVVQRTVCRRSMRPIVAVTFDDGYRDNFENAAPILRRCGVPAAFFVSTGLLDTDRGFPHDLAKLNRVVPAMTWNQVETLKRWAFSIGSHTQTHVNCVQADPVSVEAEIIGSKRDLEGRLGPQDFIFAYPYGGREDFNDHWRERVRKAGYIGCLSAYGGCNRGEIDPFNVVRTGISHAFGKWAFRARLEGWQ